MSENTNNKTNAERVLALIAEKADMDANDIKPENKWAELGIDSLDVFELIMEIEKEFFISIPDEDAHSLNTVGDAIKYVEGR